MPKLGTDKKSPRFFHLRDFSLTILYTFSVLTYLVRFICSLPIHQSHLHTNYRPICLQPFFQMHPDNTIYRLFSAIRLPFCHQLSYSTNNCLLSANRFSLLHLIQNNTRNRLSFASRLPFFRFHSYNILYFQL